MTPTDTAPSPDDAPPARRPRPTGWYVPWLAVAVAGVYLLSVVGRMTPSRQPYDLDAFGRIPAVQAGRVKPLETVARLYLRSISGQEVFIDEAGAKQPAVQWLADVMAGADPAGRGVLDKSSPAWKYKVFQVNNETLLHELKLQPREGLRFSLAELEPQLAKLFQKAGALDERRKGGRGLDLSETKVLELAQKIQLVFNIAAGRAVDNQGNKLLLLPPAEPGGDWQSPGELRDDARRASLTVALAAAKDALNKLDPGKLVADNAGVVAGRLFNTTADKLTADDLAKVVQILKEDPSELTPEAREMWLGLALDLLPAADREAIAAGRDRRTAARLAAAPAAAGWERIVAAYRAKKPDEFNAAVAEYRANDLAAVPAGDLARTRLEVFYDRFAPFYQCTGLYVFGFLLTVAGFILAAAEKPAWGKAVRRGGVWVLAFTLVVHTASLLVRMYLMDRPLVFVTNLYSSAIFIGWGCVAIGLVLERLYPLGVGSVIAAVLGVSTAIVAHNLATEDTIEMMQAVLDTNFWLAVHVTTVTLGYTATFVAGFLGAVYVYLVLATVVRDSFADPAPPTSGGLLAFGAAAAGLVAVPLLMVWFLTTAMAKFELVHSSLPSLVFFVSAAAAAVYALALLAVRATADEKSAGGPLPGLARPVAGMALDPHHSRVLGQMTYGVVCFAMLLSFFGTVSGGIWADQSWGRFWGWDPKENGAVLIVIWNALILHARWGGMVKARGVAVLAVAGNMITAWSWFGTNQLGIGLHAYGFDTRLADGCTSFWFSQLVIIGLGLIPGRYWASATGRVASKPAAGPAPVTASAPLANGHLNGHYAGGKGKKAGKRR